MSEHETPIEKPTPFTPLQAAHLQFGEAQAKKLERQADEIRAATLRDVQTDIVSRHAGKTVRFHLSEKPPYLPIGYSLEDRIPALSKEHGKTEAVLAQGERKEKPACSSRKARRS